MAPWWENAVIYEIYPRSFQDSDGDGVGDLRGVEARLDHLAWLGVDAIWLAPFYASPGADLGYDVSDHTAVDPQLGTLADFDRLLAAAHDRGIRVLVDLVASHTSVEHPWFREHPERYVWADDRPPNNWVAAFGGPAWSRDRRSGRLYLHSFYPEQPDLDWRNPEVRAAVGEVVGFWLERGVDGFRIDAVDRLLKDPALRDDPPASEPFGLPLPEASAGLDLVHSRDAPDIELALGAMREAAGGALLLGEVYLPAPRVRRYLEHLDLAFAFDLLHSPPEPEALAGAIGAGGGDHRVGTAWVLSNHDFPRVASRWGSERGARAAALLLLSLPGTAVLYQGDEIGTPDGRQRSPPRDRFGRDPYRAPMQWSDEPGAGFSVTEPWLPFAEPGERSVAAQREDRDSTLHLYRGLIALRRELRGPLEGPRVDGGLLSFRRGRHLIAINLGEGPGRPPAGGRLVLETHPGALDGELLAPRSGVVLATPR